MLSTVNEIVSRIKQAADEYERWARDGDIAMHRWCPVEGCGCRFRHRHGWLVRTVLCGGWERRIRLLRLLCPRCRKTETLLPQWLVPGSPYPWPWREAAVLDYLGGPEGYRPVAAAFDVDYTLLWGWTRRLAAVALDVVGVVVRELLQQAPGAEVQLTPVAYGSVLHKARSPDKRQGLAHLPLLTAAGGALRAACLHLAGLPEGDGPPGVLGWLSRYLAEQGAPPLAGARSHTGSHWVRAPSPP